MNRIEIFGHNSIYLLGKCLEEIGVKSILLVRGKQSFYKSESDIKIASIYRDFDVVEFYDFDRNPKFTDLQSFLDSCNINEFDAIVAIGGGSVIDMAKLIKNQAYVQLDKVIPLIAIPTTAGTGSESTSFAVLYKDRIKESVNYNYLLPEISMVDPFLLKGQSAYQLAVSGLDALSQSIESFWNVNSNTESQVLSRQAIALIWNNISLAVEGNINSQFLLSLGSFLAGKAINITKTTAPHALSYNFTSCFGLPHGHAVVLFLPFFVKYHKTLTEEDCNDLRGACYVKQQLNDLSIILGVSWYNLENEIVKLINSLSVPINFNNLGISYEEYIKVIKGNNEERMKNNPGVFKPNLVDEIYNYNTKNEIF